MDKRRGSQGRIRNLIRRWSLPRQKRKDAAGCFIDHKTRKWFRDSLHHLNFLNGPSRPLGLRNCSGMTIIELLITIAIVATLAGIAAPIFGTYVDKARSQKAISDIRTTLQAGITMYEIANDNLPVSLADISRGGMLDPWGNTYQYLNLVAAGPGWRGQARKDQLLNPLNSDYDLYSMGENVRSALPLNNRWARDDIVRANEGGYIGLASDF